MGKLGARKIPTTEAPIVFDPDVARSIVGSFAGCILGGSLFRRASYLLDREGTEVAALEHRHRRRSLDPEGTRARARSDGEGLRSRVNPVVQGGVLKTFLFDSYSARKMGRESTASASRGGGSIGASTTNFILQAGSSTPEVIVAGTERGLYVTELMGFGFQPH